MESSSGGVPHHFGLRVKMIRCAPRSTVVMMNGPADGPGPLRKPLLNACGFPVTALGISMLLPANMPFQSAKCLANVMTACRSSTPLVTDATRSVPLGEANRNALSRPLVALIWDAKSSQVMGVPSDHTAFGLIVYVTTCGSLLVSSTLVK